MTIVALLATLVLIFIFQGEIIVGNPEVLKQGRYTALLVDRSKAL